ncbi:MAG: 23S rRNA (guanosine(2251)-2'-O)-methyltransferase RlmB [Acidobacteria bacterium 13_1_20CM_2_65_9]|nr:MAG: 23S rRNA (guanosine(2251)-2'-O)-methyltransferase RlmB [Acidobacteria bacterium 13_1_20CM_2_65_9]
MRIYGINPVVEALRAKRVTAIRVSPRTDERLTRILRLAEAQGIPVRRATADELNRLAGGARHHHQGVVADVHDTADLSVEDLVAGATGAPLIVVLDQIEDPHNVGAILRTVDAAGADGLVRQSRHAARLDGAAAKASAGAVAHVKIAEVVNVARALESLKEAGVWTVGLTGDAAKRYDEVDFTLPTALVVGAEGTGLRRLVRERCDWLVSIPMRGHIPSLNVSVATGIALYEAVRQRNFARG